MAAFILGILIALQSPNPAVQQRDTRTWYQVYDAALKDIAGSRWQSAACRCNNPARTCALGLLLGLCL